jgi:cell wall-associated NlpC family hydrolase
MLKHIFLLLPILFFIGCTTQPQSVTKIIYVDANKPSTKTPKDLQVFPQIAEPYTNNITKLSYKQKEKLYKEFLKIYLLPWNMDKMQLSKKNAQWGFNYAKMTVYGENYKEISDQWFDYVIKLSNMKEYDSVREKAITVRNTNLRVFPSNKPIFKRFNQAGEGFPFDYNQNSSVNLNSPLFISHYSLDKAWAYVSASFASGWVMVKDIATVDEDVIEKFKHEDEYFVAIKDDFPIYKSGVFREYVKLGTIFPVRRGKFGTVIRDNTGKGYISRIDRNENIVKFPIEFNSKNLNNIINQLINKPYGWGGLYGNRDCSLLTKDLLTPFGFPLRRNSYGQTKNGEYISLEDKSDLEKKEIIKQQAIPFLTLVYLQGHIALYLGTVDNEPIIFHSTWGIKTLEDGNEGRHIVGKSVITSLELGKELPTYYKEKSILAKLKGIVLLSN